MNNNGVHRTCATFMYIYIFTRLAYEDFIAVALNAVPFIL